MTQEEGPWKTGIYLYFNASNPIVPEAVEAMRPFLADHYGNPSSFHWAGAPVIDGVEQARGQVAGILGCDPTEVVFTSGGSEANIHAILGVFFASRSRGGNHIVTTAVEHPATIEPCRFLERTLGARVTVLPVDRDGMVDPDDVRKAITPRTILVTVMHANNEVGTVEPVAEIIEELVASAEKKLAEMASGGAEKVAGDLPPSFRSGLPIN